MTCSHQETVTYMPVIVPGHELSSTNFIILVKIIMFFKCSFAPIIE